VEVEVTDVVDVVDRRDEQASPALFANSSRLDPLAEAEAAAHLVLAPRGRAAVCMDGGERRSVLEFFFLQIE
jgi:hypothetical protein